MTKQVKRLYEFGPFRLDVTEGVLCRNGKEIGLTPKNFEVLLVLVENNGHIVEKEVLMQKCWPDSFVEEANITQNISVLRQKLSEGGNNYQYIETIPKRGYRFTATVKEIVEEVENLSTARNSTPFRSEDLAPTHTDVRQANDNGQWVIVISATINDIDKPIAVAIEAHLRKVSKDVTLTLVRIEEGSVILILEGTRDGFERINELIKSGELSEILGFDIKELRWVASSENAKIETQHRAQTYSEDSVPQKETRVPTQSDLALKQHPFDILFGVDREQAAIRYEKIHQNLIKFFELRGAENPVVLADETIDRVARKIRLARKIDQVKEIHDLDNYFYGVARNVYLEYSLQMLVLMKVEDDELKVEYLEKGLLSLPDKERELILMYYGHIGSSKIMSRKTLATRLGISINSLRVRVMRIRRKLEKLILDYIERSYQDR